MTELNCAAISALGGYACTQWTGFSNSTDGSNHLSGFNYDAAGDLTNDGLYNYGYDAEGRQTSASSWTYNYDGLGRRVEKTNGSTGTLYWYGAGSDVLYETDLTGSSGYDSIFFGGSRLARVNNTNGNVFHYFRDMLGSSKVIVQWGQNASCYETNFEPYGYEHVRTNTCAQNYKFAGLERDSETGNDHTLFRQFNPSNGRWMSPDPLGGDVTNPQSFNRYAYVMNNPTSLIDPLGLCGQATEGYVDQHGVFQVVGYLPCENNSGGGRAGTGASDAYGSKFKCTDGTHGMDCVAESRASRTLGTNPKTKINLCKALQRARLVAQSGLSLGVTYLKVEAAGAAFAAAPVTGGASAVGTAYLMMGAGGNTAAAGIQLAGALTGNIKGADQDAAAVTTITTASGFITLVASGNPEKAATVAGFESLATTGVNGGMTGRLIDESLMGASKLLGATDIGQNIFDLLGIDAGCGG